MVEDWRRQLVITVVCSLVIVLATIMFHSIFTYTFSASGKTDDAMLVMAQFFVYMTAYFLFVALLCYQAAHSMPFMKNKPRQLSYLMLPATNAERYTTALTISLPFALLQCLVILVLSDLVQAIFTGQFYLMVTNGLSPKFTELNPEQMAEFHKMMDIFVANVIVGVFFKNSWYTLSATIFKKHPFLLGSLVCMLFSQVLSIATFGAFGLFNLDADSLDPINFWNDRLGWMYAYTAVTAVISVVMYVISYRRMSTAHV